MSRRLQGYGFKDFVSNQYLTHIHSLLVVLTHYYLSPCLFTQYLFITNPNTMNNCKQVTHVNTMITDFVIIIQVFIFYKKKNFDL